MLNAIIIEDEKPAMEALVNNLSAVTPKVNIKARLHTVKESIHYLSGEADADIIFSDVQLSDGLSFDIFSSVPVKIPVIFITGYDEFMLQAFETNGIDYLLKPVAFDRFIRAITKAYPMKSVELHSTFQPNEADKKNNSGFIYLKADRKMVKVILDDILYIESARDYLKVFTQNNSIITRQTISSVEAMLSDNEFIRIHRSYIVSVKKINSFTHETVEIGNKELPIGKFYLNSFLKYQK